MQKTIRFVYTIPNQWEEGGKCYLGKLKIHQAHFKLTKILSEEMETIFMNNIYLTMHLTLKFTLLVNFICMLKQGNHQLLMV